MSAWLTLKLIEKTARYSNYFLVMLMVTASLEIFLRSPYALPAVYLA